MNELLKIPGAKWFLVFIVLIPIIWVWITQITRTAKPTIDERIGTLKQLRDEKATHLKNIENEQKAVYLIDSKIIPMKCWIFSEVQAKQQYEMECKDYYDEQQSKITGTGELNDE